MVRYRFLHDTKAEHKIVSGRKQQDRKRALGPWWRVAASSQIHLHRFLVGGLCNLLLDTGIVTAV